MTVAPASPSILQILVRAVVAIVVALASVPVRAQPAAMTETQGRASEGPTAVPSPTSQQGEDPGGGSSEPDALARQKEPPNGLGMMIAGGVLVVPVSTGIIIGGLLLRSPNALCLDTCDKMAEPGDGLGAFVVAGFTIAGGVTLLALGGRRWHRWRAWKARVHSPVVGRTGAGTWIGGLTLRF